MYLGLENEIIISASWLSLFDLVLGFKRTKFGRKHPEKNQYTDEISSDEMSEQTAQQRSRSILIDLFIDRYRERQQVFQIQT